MQTILRGTGRKILGLTLSMALGASVVASADVRPAQADHWVVPAIAGALFGAAIVHHSHERHRHARYRTVRPYPYSVGFPVVYLPLVVPVPEFYPRQKRRHRR